MPIRVLASSDVEDLIGLPEAMECMRATFEDQARGGIAAWPPSLMRSDGALLILRSGGLADNHRMGVRVTTGPHNPSYAMVYDTPTGHLVSFMVYPFSDLRLEATVALGVDRLAAPGARRLAMIGTGRLAMGLLKAVAAVRKLDHVAVYSRREEPRAKFADRAREAIGVPVAAVSDPERAVADAEIIVTITSSTTPALRGKWLAPGTLVTACGLRDELDEDVFLRASQIVTTSKVQEMNIHDKSDDWPLVRAMRSGGVDWNNVIELGDVVSGRVAPADGIRVLREAQGGFGDIALAALAYERAAELGRGTQLDLH